jgi:hypothetical protein
MAQDRPKLKPAAPETEAAAPAGQIRGGLAVAPGGQVTISGGVQMTPGPNGNMHIESKRMTMKLLVDAVARIATCR